MKPLAFNLKDAKKVAGDKQSSTFMLKDGHQIKVAHAPLPALQRKQLEKLPVHLDVGGTSSGETPGEAGDSAPDQAPTPEALSQGFQDLNFQKNANQADADNSNPPVPDASGAPPNNILSAIAPDQNAGAPSTDLPDQGAPVGTQDAGTSVPAGTDVNALLAKGQSAIKDQQAVETALAQSNRATEESDIDAKQDLLAGFQKNSADIQEQQQKFMKDFADNKIDPKHYVENMNAVQKVGTAIGLFLGGWNAQYGKTGQNPALDFLNKQIDRDISAQQSRIDQQKTLLGANQELYHDSILANNATRMQMNDIYNHKIQLNADELGTPAAAAKAKMASVKFALENQQLAQQSALRATILHSVAQGGRGVEPIDLGHAGFMDPAQAQKEQESVDRQKNAIRVGTQLFGELDKEQSTGNLANPQSYLRRNQIKAELTNQLLAENPSPRYSKELADAEITPLLFGTGATDQTRGNALQKYLDIVRNHNAGTTPVTAKYAPLALPKYGSNKPQFKVGDIVYKNGQKGQVVDQQGTIRAVK